MIRFNSKVNPYVKIRCVSTVHKTTIKLVKGFFLRIEDCHMPLGYVRNNSFIINAVQQYIIKIE